MIRATGWAKIQPPLLALPFLVAWWAVMDVVDWARRDY